MREICPICNGSGRQMVDDGYASFDVDCDNCGGEGFEDFCPAGGMHEWKEYESISPSGERHGLAICQKCFDCS